MKKKILLALAVLMITIIAACVGLYLYYEEQSDLVYKEVFVEAGTSECDVSEFLKKDNSSAKFSNESSFDSRVPGDYKLTIIATLPIFGVVACYNET